MGTIDVTVSLSVNLNLEFLVAQKPVDNHNVWNFPRHGHLTRRFEQKACVRKLQTDERLDEHFDILARIHHVSNCVECVL